MAHNKSIAGMVNSGFEKATFYKQIPCVEIVIFRKNHGKFYL